ncbi:MAG TPA: hypothetical protein VG167_09535 [Verrucomicrobiae bacterium]|nr:hypothetical protein [Verrucomicrobiae bacterium]
MQAPFLRQAVRFVVGWSVAVFFVVLLTLIFSFLGTIICAALAGMMIGAARLPRWQALLISLIFPAVIFTVLHASGAALTARQIEGLSVLCLAAFWLIYAVMWALLGFENAPAGASAQARARNSVEAKAPCPSGSAHPICARDRLNLEALQGRWCWENPAGAHGSQKILQVENQTLRLLTGGPDTRCACGLMRLTPVETDDTLVCI